MQRKKNGYMILQKLSATRKLFIETLIEGIEGTVPAKGEYEYLNTNLFFSIVSNWDTYETFSWLYCCRMFCSEKSINQYLEERYQHFFRDGRFLN